MPFALHPATFDQVPLPSTGFVATPYVVTPSGPVPAPELHVCDPEYVAAFASGTPARSNKLTSNLTDAERLLLPRAESSSDAATQAPSASFQIERYVRFMSCYLQMCTPHTGLFC
ncbi:hypothetical protein BCEP27_50090 [Burkholderia cepacia]